MKVFIHCGIVSLFLALSFIKGNTQCLPFTTDPMVLCTGLTVEFDADCNGGLTWTLSAGSTGSTEGAGGNTSNTYEVILGNTPGDITVTVEKGGTSYDSIFSILESPVANAGLDDELTCDDTQVTLDGSSSTGAGTLSYSWSGGNIVSGGSTSMPTVDAAATYTLVVMDVGSMCTDSDQVIVSENISAPTADAGSTVEITCANPTVMLDGTGSSSGGSITYSWTSSPSGGVVSGGSTTTPTVNQAGTYILLVTDTSNGCTSTDQVSVTEDVSAPTADAGSTEEITCANPTVMLDGSGSSSGGSITYSWTSSPPGGIVSGGTTDSPTVNQAGTYTLLVTDTSNGCFSTDDVVVTEDVNPPTANAGSTVVITCSNTSVMLDGSGSSSGAGITYSWTSTPSGGVVSGGSTTTPTVDQTGTYTILVTDTNSGCTATDDVVVTEDVTPPIANAGTGMELNCTTTSIVLDGSGSSSGGNITYSWTSSPSGGIVSGGSTATPTINQPGIYTISVTNTTNGCSATSGVTITQDINIPTANAGNTMELTCTNPTVNLDGSGSSAGADITYSWSSSPPGGVVSGGSSVIPTVDQPGTYTILVTDTGNGCTSTDQVIVSENVNLPTASAGNTMEITCAVTSVVLNGSGSSSGASIDYLWQADGGGNIVSGDDTNSPVVNQGGTYILLVTDTDNGCTATDQVVVTEDLVAPTFNNVNPESPTCFDGIDGQIEITMSGSGNYTWVMIPEAQGPGTETNDNFNIGPLSANTYSITVTDSGNGCFSISNNIMVSNPPALVANVTSDDGACIGEANGSYQINSVTNGNGPYTYTDNNGNSGGPSGLPIIVDNIEAGNYQLTVTDSDGCTSMTAVNVEQDPSPEINNILNNCDGGALINVVVDASISTGTLQYRVDGGPWQSSNTFTSLSFENHDFDVREMTTECEVSETHEVGCDCPTVTNNTIGSDQSICNDDTANELVGSLPTINPDESYTFQWQSRVSGTGIWEDEVVTQNYTPSNVNETTDYRRLVQINECDDYNSNIIQIEIKPDPVVSNSTTSKAICSGDFSGGFILESSPSGANYTWSSTATNASGNTSNGSGNIPSEILTIVGNVSQGTVDYSVSPTLNGCMGQPTDFTVNVFNNPDFTIETSQNNSNILCSGSTMILSTDLSNPSNFTITWTRPGGTQEIGPSLSITTGGTYECMVTNNATNCSATESIDIVFSEVNAPISTNTNTTEICFGEEITIIVGGGANILWDSPVPSSENDEFSIDVSPDVTTTYSATVSNSLGCEKIVMITIEVNPLPVPMINANSSKYCEGENVVLSTQYQGGHVWNTGSENDKISFNADPDFEEFSVTYTDPKGCEASDNITLDIKEIPFGEIISTISVAETQEVIPYSVDPDLISKDGDCDVVSFDWFVNDVFIQNTAVSNPNFEYTFSSEGEYEVSVVVNDNCECSSNPSIASITIFPNGSCKASIASIPQICAGIPVDIVATPVKGGTGANTPFEGYFIIEGEIITVADENMEFTNNGKTFRIEEVNQGEFNDFNAEITVTFLDEVEYEYEYYYHFGSCMQSTSTKTANVVPIPDFDNVIIDDEACFGESPRIEFTPNSNAKMSLKYQVNGMDQPDLTLSSSSANFIEFPNLMNPNNDVEINLVSLNYVLSNDIVGCINDELDPSSFTIDVLEPISYTISDTCDAELVNISYTLELEGGTGEYNINGNSLDGANTYETGFIPSGDNQVFLIIDEGCDEDNLINESFNSECENCLMIQDSVAELGIVVSGDQNLCEGEIAEFTLSELPNLNPLQTMIYTIQREPNQFYDEDNVILDSIPADQKVFRFDFNSSPEFEFGVTYYITAYVFSKQSGGFKVDGLCAGLINKELRFYETPVAEISLMEDMDVCKNEIDYQLGLNTDVSKSTWSSSNSMVTFRYEDGDDRVLLDFDENITGPVVIDLLQENIYSQANDLSCSDETSITLNVLDQVAPSKDSIFMWPGNLFAYTDTSENLCFQWLVNGEIVAGEDTRFYIHGKPIADDIISVDVYDCSDTDLACVTTAYFNLVDPPKLVFQPQSEIKINIYPNPNNGLFTINLNGEQGGKFIVNFFSSTGQLISSDQLIKEETDINQEIDLSSLPSGLIIVQIIDEGGKRYLEKVVKN